MPVVTGARATRLAWSWLCAHAELLPNYRIRCCMFNAQAPSQHSQGAVRPPALHVL